MKTPTNRRDFLTQAVALASAPLASSAAATALAAPNTAKDRVMVVWLPHSVFPAGRKGQKIDEGFFAGVMGKCADHGFTTVYIAPRYVGKGFYHSKVVPMFDSMYGMPDGKTLADTLKVLDPYDVAVREAKRRGLKVIAQTSLFDHWFPGLEDGFYASHPENLMVDRRTQGLYYEGVPCYAVEGTQEYCLAEIKELIDRGAEGISFEMDSHQIGWWPPGYGSPQPDSFGFNPPLVEEFQQRYGVNVIKDDFDKAKWYALHGEFFTRFLRRVKAELKDKPLIVGMPPEGYLCFGAQPYWHGTLGYFSQAAAVRINLGWQKWLQDGTVDALRLYISGPKGPFGPYLMTVAEAIKRDATHGKCYLSVTTAELEEIRQLTTQALASTLDGYVVHEEAYFEGKPELWKAFE